MYQFADDTCLVSSSRNIEEALRLLQEDFDALAKWSHDVGLIINVSKTKFMYISSSHNRHNGRIQLTAHNHDCLHNHIRHGCQCPPVEMVQNQRYLGLIIDDRFQWKARTNSVCDKL